EVQTCPERSKGSCSSVEGSFEAQDVRSASLEPGTLKDRLRSSPRIVVRYFANLIEPSGGFAIAGRSVISARRKGAAASNLRCIRYATTLELAGLKKAPSENGQPSLDIAEAVLIPSFHRDVRPISQGAISP